ncbi:MAG TPA: YidC/Oxa1 family membrane protein insertase, partial [Solirubrobacterales bacterium]|nr:YidC/Oxa1 family membrane protein insertase [Solirubrobacterales bacterium]
EANILQPLIDAFNSILKWLHNDIGVSWGLGIVLITWLSRAVVLPFTLKSMHGMREMQALQPHLKEIQEKYKDDRQRMQREQMALFQEHGVNPLSACLPLLFQFPVFIALYALLRSSTFKNEVGDTGWLFVPDLTQHPTGAVAAVLIVLSVLSTFALLFFNPSPTTGGASQRYLMAGIFSLFTVFLIPNAPAGIAVYFIASGVWQVAQQGVIRVVWPLPPVPTPEEVRATRPPPPPPRKRKRRK